MINEKDKNLLLSKIDIVALISEYVNLKKTGSGFKGLSPFKEEKTPSFMVSPAKGIFKDFSSGIGGDAIKFYMLMHNLDYVSAMEELAKKYNVEIKINHRKEDYNTKYYKLMSDVLQDYKQNLYTSKEALNYLENRGYTLSDIKKFNLGYALNKWDSEYLKYKDSDKLKELVELGIITNSNDRYFDFFKNRIIFPITNIKGDIISFGGRDISGSKDVAKYINSKESRIFRKSNELFGIFDGGNKIKEYNSCILVEGYFDVLALHKNNIQNAIASLGTSLTLAQAEYIRKFTNNIVLAYDNDSAGLNAKIRAIQILNKYGFNIKVMDYSNIGKDPDEILYTYGKDKFVEELGKSIDAFDFLYKYYLKSNDITKLGAKMKLISDMDEYFSSLTNMIYYEEFAKRFAEKLDISLNALKSNLSKAKTKRKINSTKLNTNTKRKSITRKESLEEQTIIYLIKHKNKCTLFQNFTFENLNFENILNKIENNELFDDEEKELIFHLNTKYENFDTDNYTLLYREWVIDYIKNSREMIVDYLGGYDAMGEEDYAMYMTFLKRVKEIEKSVDLPKIKEVYYDYMEYEKGKLHAFRKGEENE